MNSRWRALARASADVLAASCRLHRERATARLRTAHENLSNAGESNPEWDLMRDLANYVTEYEGEDPHADKLIARCREAGVLRR